MIFNVTGASGGKVGAWKFTLETTAPTTVKEGTIYALVASTAVSVTVSKTAPTSPAASDVWFRVDDVYGNRLITSGGVEFYLLGAYQWSSAGSAWVQIDCYMAFLGEWQKIDGLPPLGTALNDCTWAQIDAVGKAGKQSEYFTVGDTKSVTMKSGEIIILRIIDFNHDVLSAPQSSETAPYTFDVQGCLNASAQLNSADTNVGGYTGCAFYTTLRGSIKNMLPDDLLGVMKTVSKNSSNVSPEEIFLLSEMEVFGVTTSSPAGEGRQYAYYVSSGMRIKRKGDAATEWWLRSISIAGAAYFFYVSADGSNSRGGAASIRGISFGVCV